MVLPSTDHFLYTRLFQFFAAFSMASIGFSVVKLFCVSADFFSFSWLILDFSVSLPSEVEGEFLLVAVAPSDWPRLTPLESVLVPGFTAGRV